MGRIVNAVVVDLTRAVEQKGFKSGLIYDTTTVLADGPKIIYDTEGLTGDILKCASAFFANGGQSVVVAGELIDLPTAIAPSLDALAATSEFYLIMPIIATANQGTFLPEILTWAEGMEKIVGTEVNGDVTTVMGAITEDLSSDRLLVYANSGATVEGLHTAVAGVCLPQDEGSITWGNKAVTGVPTSGYSLADEATLLSSHINYITKEMGLIISQMGRTTSGSNIDITRSKDYLKNRLMEALTSALVNSKKVPYTTAGMAVISSAMNQVGVQAVSQGMLTSFKTITPPVDSIPTNDKANRVLNGVVFEGVLSGAIETISLEIVVKL